VGEPTDSSTWVSLELQALGIQKVVVIFLLCQVADSVRRARTGRAGFHRGPTVLRKDDLLAIRLGVDPLQVALDQTPRSFSGGGLGAEERQHVEIDKVHDVQDRLSAAVGLETGDQIGDSDEDTEGSEFRLCKSHIEGEGDDRQCMIEQGLGTELNGPGDKLGLGVVLESIEETVLAGQPLLVAIKSELEGFKGLTNTHRRWNVLMDGKKTVPRSMREHQFQRPTRLRQHHHFIWSPLGEWN